MEREARRDLEILTELARDAAVTQRGLARKLGIALGLANLDLKTKKSMGTQLGDGATSHAGEGEGQR